MTIAPTPVLETSAEINAPVEHVWRAVSDLKRMSQWSPHTVRMFVLGKPRVGAVTVNINKDGWKIYPTTARIVALDPNRRIAWRVFDNRMVWAFEFEATPTGTKLTHSRKAPDGQSPFSVFFTTRLEGKEQFEGKMLDGMRRSVERIKAALDGS